MGLVGYVYDEYTGIGSSYIWSETNTWHKSLLHLQFRQNQYPFHLDMSTSVVTAGKMEVYAKNKKPCPEGWLVDENGAVNTDAGVFVANRGTGRGGLLPIGGAGELHSGHKGYGMSMLVEIMTGIFAGGVTSSGVRVVKEKELCCHMFWAIDPAMFNEDKEEIFKHLSEFLPDDS